MDRAALIETVREFGLGRVLDARPLPAGHDVVALHTERGAFVIKKPWHRIDVELYAEVEQHLNRQGIRQARQFRRPDGDLVSSTGHGVQELLPGSVLVRPDPSRTAAVITHLAHYDRALAGIEVPAELAARDTVWARVVRTDHLLDRVPGLIAQHAPKSLDPGPVRHLLALLAAGAARLDRQPKQLVHGDLGPDNVLHDRGTIVAVIDFTPFHDSVLLGLASLVYFFQVQGRAVDPGRLEASFETYGADREVAWLALVRETLRRLATPLAVAELHGETVPAERIRSRWAAAVRLAEVVAGRR